MHACMHVRVRAGACGCARVRAGACRCVRACARARACVRACMRVVRVYVMWVRLFVKDVRKVLFVRLLALFCVVLFACLND